MVLHKNYNYFNIQFQKTSIPQKNKHKEKLEFPVGWVSIPEPFGGEGVDINFLVQLNHYYYTDNMISQFSASDWFTLQENNYYITQYNNHEFLIYKPT